MNASVEANGARPRLARSPKRDLPAPLSANSSGEAYRPYKLDHIVGLRGAGRILYTSSITQFTFH